MPATLDWSAVKDNDQLHEDNNEWCLTEAFAQFGWGYGLFHTLGMNSITEENVGEVWARMSIIQALTFKGAFFFKWDGENQVPFPVTRKDIVRRIGLKSNYSTLTRAKWITERLKPLMDVCVDETLDTLPAKELQVS